jgi:hypothetical protein
MENQLMSEMAIEQAVQKFLFGHYGDLIIADAPIFDTTEQVYVANLRSDYPLMIQDDKMQETKLHILKVDHLGSVYVDKDLKVMQEKSTPRELCVDNLKLFFNLWLKRAEEIIVSCSAEALVNVSRFRHYFDPIEAILVSICDYGKVTDKEISSCRSPERLQKIEQYLNLLEGLKIVRRSEDGYIAGNIFSMISEDRPDYTEEELRKVLLSYIIKERYPTLRDVFKLTILEPTIHVDNCIYLPEIEEENPIYRTVESIGRDYREYYSKRISTLNLRLNLRRLENAKAIERDGKHYFGNENLLKQMINTKKTLSPISMGLFSKP